TLGPILGTAGRQDNVMYVPSEDYNLYAFDTSRAQLQWRFSGASPIVRSVEATRQDVFVVPEYAGLTRVDRLSGKAVWTNKASRRFLATNNKYVYAADAFGNLL